MKVCFFIASLGDGGAQRQCVALLNQLQHRHEVEVHLVLLSHGEHDASLDTTELTVHRTEVANFASPLALLFLIRTLWRVRPDVLISWLHPADIWSYVATRLFRRVQWVLTERGSAEAYHGSVVYRVRMFAGRRGAATIIANSVPGEQLWQRLRPRAPIRVIPNMLIEPLGLRGLGDRSSFVDCLTVSRLEPQKNLTGLACAFVRFARSNADARLVVAGQGSSAVEVKRITQEGGVAGRTQLLGFRNDVPLLMSRSRLLLTFSKHEGMPNVLMEAVAQELPAVVSDIPEHRALLGDEYPYYVTLQDTPEQSAAVIARAWSSPISPETYRHARDVLTRSTPEAVTLAYLTAFGSVAATGARGRVRPETGSP